MKKRKRERKILERERERELKERKGCQMIRLKYEKKSISSSRWVHTKQIVTDVGQKKGIGAKKEKCRR